MEWRVDELCSFVTRHYETIPHEDLRYRDLEKLKLDIAQTKKECRRPA